MSTPSLTAFFVDALSSALELGIATPNDVLRHVTPDVLSVQLPRPLWAKLLAACLAAPRADAKLVVETVGVQALCENIQGTILWACLAEVGQRALGKSIITRPPAAVTAERPAEKSAPTAVPVASPPSPSGAIPSPARPPTGPVAVPSSEPAPLGAPPAGSGTQRLPGLGRPPTSPGLPSSSSSATGNGARVTGAGASTRRPQAQATPVGSPSSSSSSARPAPRTGPPAAPGKRPSTNSDFEVETDVGAEWKKQPTAMIVPDALAVDDEQLVDWASEETVIGTDERKR